MRQKFVSMCEVPCGLPEITGAADPMSAERERGRKYSCAHCDTHLYPQAEEAWGNIPTSIL